MDIKDKIKRAIEVHGADMEKLNDLFGMVRLCEDAKERRTWLLYLREQAKQVRSAEAYELIYRTYVLGAQDPRAAGIVDVVIYVCYSVSKLHYKTFKRFGSTVTRVIYYSVADLISEIKPLSVVLKPFHHPQALIVVSEVGRITLLHCILSRVTEWGVTEVMPKTYRLAKILVEP